MALAAFINTLLLLQSVNKYRSYHCSPETQWSTTVQTSAQNWADFLAKNNAFYHSFGKYGENLAIMFDESAQEDKTNITINAIKSWYSEVENYDFDNPGWGWSTGHFTQLVWKSTKYVGVGIAVNSFKRVIVVMQFDPPGNVNSVGEFIENVPRLCSVLSPPPSPPPPPPPPRPPRPPRPLRPSPSPPLKPVMLYIKIHNNDKNGYTTVKAILSRSVLQTLAYPYVAKVTYLNNTGESTSDYNFPRVYDINYLVGPFESYSTAIKYANSITPSSFTSVKNMNVSDILYNFA